MRSNYIRSSQAGFTLVELMVVIGILGLLVGILAVAVLPQIEKARKQSEVKQMSDVMAEVQMIQTDRSKLAKLRSEDMKDQRGYQFYNAALKKNIFSAEMISKLVSLNTDSDFAADNVFLETEDGHLEAGNCSYTAPIASSLMTILGLKGSKRKVVVGFNSRNWNNYDGAVLVQWSDGQSAEYLEYDSIDYDIGREEWLGGDNITGVQAPFDMTFDGNE